MFENIGSFFKKIMKNDTKELVSDTTLSNASKEAAKERLQLVLMQDRANVSADFLELMKQEIVDVIKKYIVVEEETIDVRIINQENADGTQGAPSLCANIPILNIRNDNKGEKFRNEQSPVVTKEDVAVEENVEENSADDSKDDVEIENVVEEKVEEVEIQEENIEKESEASEENVEQEVQEVKEEAEVEKNIEEIVEELEIEDFEQIENVSADEDEEDDDDVTFDDLLKAAEEEEKNQKAALASKTSTNNKTKKTNSSSKSKNNSKRKKTNKK